MKQLNGAFSDDDTDIEYMYLLAMEKHGIEPTYAQLAEFWLHHVRREVWLANRAAVGAMRYGYTPPWTGMKAVNPALVPDRSATGQRDLGGHRAGHGPLCRAEIRVGGANHERRLGSPADRSLRRDVCGGLLRDRYRAS